MEKIKEFRLSLMEKDKDVILENEEKAGFIIRTSAIFNIEEYFINHAKEKLKGEELENFISTISLLIFDELMDKCKLPVDTLGIWITVNGKIYENSMDIEVLEKMKEYGEEDVNPIFELIKMTLLKCESKTS